MAKKTADKKYNSNLASEYLMMSVLSRACKDAYLTIGNKKGVDILVKTQKGGCCMLEVKGVNKNDAWIIGNNNKLPSSPNMFYALVGFEGKINEVVAPAKFYLIPSIKLNQSGEFRRSKNKKTVYLSHKHIRENYSAYLNTFKWLDNYLESN